MNELRWKDAVFSVPATMVDETVIVLVEDVEEAGFSITMARDELGPGLTLERYVEVAKAELGAEVDTCLLRSSVQKTIGGRAAFLVAVDLVVAGAERLQTQAFVGCPSEVLVLTLTSIRAASGRAKRTFEELLDGLVFDD